MGKAPAFQFYPGDWIQDTRILSPATRGIWIDMLCFMWRAEDRGKLSGSECQLTRILSCEKEELNAAIEELSVTKIADVTVSNGYITVTNRRMYREQKERESGRIRAKRFRDNASSNADSNGEITPPSSSSSSNKKDTTYLSSAQPNCPHQEIISSYNEILGPYMPIVKAHLWTGARARNLQARWRERPKRQSVEWWAELFTSIKEDMPFLLSPWKGGGRCNLGWIVKPDNFAKILEGNYVNETGRPVLGNSTIKPRVLDGVLSGSGNGEKPRPEPPPQDGGKGVAQDSIPMAGDGGRGHGEVQKGD